MNSFDCQFLSNRIEWIDVKGVNGGRGIIISLGADPGDHRSSGFAFLLYNDE